MSNNQSDTYGLLTKQTIYVRKGSVGEPVPIDTYFSLARAAMERIEGNMRQNDWGRQKLADPETRVQEISRFMGLGNEHDWPQGVVMTGTLLSVVNGDPSNPQFVTVDELNKLFVAGKLRPSLEKVQMTN